MICHTHKNHKYACVYTGMIFLIIFYMYIEHLHNSNQISFPYGHLLLIVNFPWDLHNSNNFSGPLSVRNLCKICVFLSFACAAFEITKSDWL